MLYTLKIQFFGGRGASSGMSDKGHKYGEDYKTVLSSGNIKFVKATSNNSESLMETMTKGRVYVLVNNQNKLNSIIYFDSKNKRNKVINLLHKHNGVIPHTHHGYIHNENDGKRGASKLDTKESRMVDNVYALWDNHLRNILV